MNPDKKITMTRIGKYLCWLLLPVVAAAAIYYNLWIENPLPSDEQMIENFKAHRADFDEVVRRYRNYPRPPKKDTSFWFKEGDTMEIFKRAGIDRIDYGGIGVWLPNPYSVETADWVHKAYMSGLSIRLGLSYKYSALQITPATTPRINHPDQSDDSGYNRITFIHAVIWKNYYFFPEAPRIENGELLWPPQIVGKSSSGSQFHEKEGVATYQSRSRVLPSLNRLPDHWKDFECVYRQIEPQWFLCMCNGH